MTEQMFGNNQIPPEERQAIGKGGRKQVPRSSHGDWSPATDRPDPLDLLQLQDKGRLQRRVYEAVTSLEPQASMPIQGMTEVSSVVG